MAKSHYFEKTGQSNKVYRHRLISNSALSLWVSEVPKERKCFIKIGKSHILRHAGELGKTPTKHIKGAVQAGCRASGFGNPQKWFCANPRLYQVRVSPRAIRIREGKMRKGTLLDAEVQRTGGAAGGKIPKGARPGPPAPQSAGCASSALSPRSGCTQVGTRCRWPLAPGAMVGLWRPHPWLAADNLRAIAGTRWII